MDDSLRFSLEIDDEAVEVHGISPKVYMFSTISEKGFNFWLVF